MLLATNVLYRRWLQASCLIFTEISRLRLILDYRYFTREHAQAYKLTGWVRNKSDGNVSRALHVEPHAHILNMCTRSRAKHREGKEKWQSS